MNRLLGNAELTGVEAAAALTVLPVADASYALNILMNNNKSDIQMQMTSGTG